MEVSEDHVESWLVEMLASGSLNFDPFGIVECTCYNFELYERVSITASLEIGLSQKQDIFTYISQLLESNSRN